MKPPETPDLRLREAVRALVVDPDHRLLLVRFEFPAGTRWALPGGGLEPDETHHDALSRELAEEVGLRDATIGPHIWNRLHIVPFLDGRYDGQRERIFLVRSRAFDPAPALTWAELNAEHVFELRWWSMQEIAASDTTFVPRELAALAQAVLTEGPPVIPIEVSA
jgi:8-oxo-dGTP diphosphatase